MKPTYAGLLCGTGVKGGCHGIDSTYTPSEKAAAPIARPVRDLNARLNHSINIAWNPRGAERFNVVAKAEDPAKTTEQQLLTMRRKRVVDSAQRPAEN